MEHIYDMLIVGGGPAGYTAALYAARAGLDVLVLEKLSAGGQMALTDRIDNYPGFPQGIDGFTLGEAMQESAHRFGAKTELAQVLSLELKDTPKRLNTDQGPYWGRTVVYAAGAGPRALELPGEQALTGKGVHYCAACDGMRYRGKTVVVAGGGNSAVEDALMLANIAEKVLLVHRRDTLRADKIYRDALSKAKNVQLILENRVTALLGQDKLTGVVVTDAAGTERTIPCDGLFISIGRKPATALVQQQLALDESGYIQADESTRTSLPGVFAVGDVRTKALRQVVTAVADGAMAAHAASEYLQMV